MTAADVPGRRFHHQRQPGRAARGLNPRRIQPGRSPIGLQLLAKRSPRAGCCVPRPCTNGRPTGISPRRRSQETPPDDLSHDDYRPGSPRSTADPDEDFLRLCQPVQSRRTQRSNLSGLPRAARCPAGDEPSRPGIVGSGRTGLSGTIAGLTKWDRKQYYYPDLPKAYQISHTTSPFARAGIWMLTSSRKMGDPVAAYPADPSAPGGRRWKEPPRREWPGGDSRVDLNRAGTPFWRSSPNPTSISRRGPTVPRGDPTADGLPGRLGLQHAGGQPPL
ncbi:MAG: hypothetical protein Ct9H300mP1_21140 [Planctomycetaceae bacterium]|nr:MAG: hypothetical protein Ct9H300mP1_21140 [Planctomycetaceae bacterium]